MSAETNKSKMLEQYQADGFSVFRGFLASTALAELRSNVDRLLGEMVPNLPREHVFYEDRNDSATLKQIQHLEEHDAWFHGLLTAGLFRELAESLLGGPVVPKNMQYFNKPPGIGLPTPPHQDGYYFMLDPCEALTMWFALDDVDEENGCVRYATGSHRLGMRRHDRTGTLGFSQGIVNYPTEQDRLSEVALPAEPGDLLVHDALTIHRADQNRSVGRSRRALGLIYYSQNAREDTAAHAAYQQRLSDEMKSAGRI